jgi:hypothetical protein
MSFSLLLSLAMAASQPSFTVWPEGERGRFTVARGQLKLTALLRCPWATQSATPPKMGVRRGSGNRRTRMSDCFRKVRPRFK